MANPAIEQSGYASGTAPTSGTTYNVTLTSVTAGNAIVILLRQSGAANRTYTAVSDNDGAPDAWEQKASSNANQIAAGYWLDVTGGTTEISVTCNFAYDNDMEVFEVSADTLDQAFVTLEFTDVTTADLAGAGTVPIAAESIIFMGWQPNASCTITASGYTATDIEAAGNDEFWYKINTSSIADENGTIGATVGTRDGPSVFFSLKNTAAASTTPFYHRRHIGFSYG